MSRVSKHIIGRCSPAARSSAPHFLSKTTLLQCVLIAFLICTMHLVIINAQFNFGGFGGLFGGGGGGGSVTDPVPILLAAQNALTQCYSFSGQLNNVDHPQWGSTSEPLLRAEGNSYPNNEWAEALKKQRPNPRTISNAISHETCAEATRNAEVCYNDWLWLWGQYVDHDLTHVPTFPRGTPEAKMTITAPSNDPFLPNRIFPHSRSFVDQQSPDNANEQINLATSYLDSSQIYGATIQKADSIRTFRNGMLKSTFDGFMPILSSRLGLDHSSVPTFDELGSPVNKDQFLCADMRCNQHAPMAALQAMYIREHNRIALALAQANHPAYNTDEVIYQTARACVIAMNQAITYNEFLPLVLGQFNLPAYSGYKKNVRATVSNAFSTAGWRTIHSMVGCDFKEQTASGQNLRSIGFASSFFDSTWIRNLPAQPNRQGREQNAWQTVMNGLGRNPSARMDAKVSPVLRTVQFNGQTSTTTGEKRGDVAFDVVASDIQRGRDHGLLSYREMRRMMGWRDIQQYADITLQQERVNALTSIYGEGGIDEVELFVGLMLEDPLEGALLGPVATSIVQDQFARTRDGDRCWYENQFTGQLLNAFKATKLKHLVDRNFNAQSNPFASESTVGVQPVRPTVTIPKPSTATSASIVSTTNAGTANRDANENMAVPSGSDAPVFVNPSTGETPAEIKLTNNNNNGDDDLVDILRDDAENTAAHATSTLSIGQAQHGVLNPVVTLSTDQEMKRRKYDKDLHDKKYVDHVDKKKYHHRDGEDDLKDVELIKKKWADYKEHKKTFPEGYRPRYNRTDGDDTEDCDDNKEGKPHHHGMGHRKPTTIDGTADYKRAHQDPEKYSTDRKRSGRSRLDNGASTRRALPFDEVVGVECDDKGCFDVAWEYDPILADDPKVLEWLKHYREKKRAEQLKHPETTPTSDILDVTASTILASPTTQTGPVMETLQSHRNFRARTMQVNGGISINRPKPPQGPLTEHTRRANGRNALVPTTGIFQTDIPQQLSQVSNAVRQDNIFLTPQCRT